jgi:mono/diheme cytochrome c family protein
LRPRQPWWALSALATTQLAMALLAGCRPTPHTTPEQYQAYCANCHGRDGRGEPKSLAQNPAADLLSSAMMQRGDRAAIRRRIADGYGPMPGYARRLSPPEIERMIAFVLQLRTPHPRER